MSAEAEKVINLSLCKMAESRGIRRGGSSLHKHLLIASVLTKARSAYFENWYLGDNDCPSVSERDGFSSPAESASGTGGTDDQIALSQILDPSFFVEVEAEIELPSDILNCVEKLGDMSEMHMGFTVSEVVNLNSRLHEEGEDMLSEVDDRVTSSTTDMIEGDIESQSEKVITNSDITFTYLDLNSSKEVPRSSTTVPVSANPLPSLFPIISSPITSQVQLQCTSKRRRDWSFELEDDSDDEEEVTYSSSPDLKDKLKLKLGGHHFAKRLRSSISSNSTTEVFNSGANLNSFTPMPVLFNFEENNFRTKKSHFEVDEEEDSSTTDGDTFLEEDEDSWCAGKTNSSERNDRRVPSASSSCSSDEEQDSGSCSMEVDQITSLVQYFSFQKQQGKSAPVGSASNAKTTSSTSQSQFSSLSRSMSTPDLCSRSGNGGSNSGNSISCPKTKDLFSSYGLSNSHRVLSSMKV